MDDNYDIDRAKLEFDREKHQQEIALREREVELKHIAHEKSLFCNPLLLAIVAGGVGLFSNAIVALVNGYAQRNLEFDRLKATQQLDESKAEAARILEAPNTAAPDMEHGTLSENYSRC